MTHHSHYDYHCPGCGTQYICYKEGACCPECNMEGTEVYDIVGEAITSYWYNVDFGGVFGVFSLGDHYLLFLHIYPQSSRFS